MRLGQRKIIISPKGSTQDIDDKYLRYQGTLDNVYDLKKTLKEELVSNLLKIFIKDVHSEVYGKSNRERSQVQ